MVYAADDTCIALSGVNILHYAMHMQQGLDALAAVTGDASSAAAASYLCQLPQIQE